jgi:hypothetical protein
MAPTTPGFLTKEQILELEKMTDFAERARNVARSIAVCLYKNYDDEGLGECIDSTVNGDPDHLVPDDDGSGNKVFIPIC